MAKAPRMLTLRSRTSPRWECILGRGLSFSMHLHEMSTWRFVSIPHLWSNPLPDLFFLSTIACLNPLASFVACQISHLSFSFFSLLHTTSIQPETPMVNQTDCENITYSPPPQTHSTVSPILHYRPMFHLSNC